jgi:ubiquinone/menaquinone biosynthesis C-methylase UbiE
MISLNDNVWWHPDYGFYNLNFYPIGDHSNEGFSRSRPLTREQRTKREIEFIIKYLRPKKDETILDCPCGDGRHVLELAKKGYKVTGLDINRAFLDLGIKGASESKLKGSANFLERDMLELNLPLNSFDHALNMFTSFGFFELDRDNEKVLENLFLVLKAKGNLLLYFDYNATRIINHKYFHGDENKSRKCDFKNKKYELYVDEHYDRIKQRLVGSWTLRNGGPPVTKKYSIRIYSNKEIEELLLLKGFKEVKFFDPNSARFSDNSTETIIIAKK